MSGNDPWIGTDNAYGIAYNLFGVFNAIHNKLPKLIFLMTYLIAVRYIINYCQRIGFDQTKIVSCTLLLNPLFWIFIVINGSNDAFVAGTTALSLVAILNQRPKTAGTLLAIGSSFKFMPLFLIPFLLMEKKEGNYKLLHSFTGTVLVFLVIGYGLWGTSILEPFFFGSERQSKMFSVFRFVRGEFQPFEILGITNLDSYSVPLMLISWSFSIFIYFRYSLEKYLMLFFSFSNILLFYKVGHHQFYILLLFLSIFAYIINYRTMMYDRAFMVSLIAFWVWIFCFTVIYSITHFRGEFSIIREFLGLPTFVLHLALNFFMLRHVFKYSKRLPVMSKKQ